MRRRPAVSSPRPAVVVSDARGGIAHTGFDEGFDDLVKAARRCGVAVFSQRCSFTSGQLGWFTEKLADIGLIALATAVSPAQLATASADRRVFGTNPVAYSVPRAEQAPLTVDQASSSTSFVSVRDAADRGARLPEGWAVDADGFPTTDAEAALSGALLPFGGYKGANIALLVELLSSMGGGLWSVDAPPWDSGARLPSVGQFVLAVEHETFAEGYPARVEAHLERLAGYGVRRLGDSRAEQAAAPDDQLTLRADTLAELRRRANPDGPQQHQQRKEGTP